MADSTTKKSPSDSARKKSQSNITKKIFKSVQSGVRMKMMAKKRQMRRNQIDEDIRDYNQLEKQCTHNPEIIEILKAESYAAVIERDKDEHDTQHGPDDYDFIRFQMLDEMKKYNFDATVVESKIEEAFGIISKLRNMNNKVKDKMDQRDLEVQAMAEKFQKDQRVTRALRLAKEYRDKFEDSKSHLARLEEDFATMEDSHSAMSNRLHYTAAIIESLRSTNEQQAELRNDLELSLRVISDLTNKLKACEENAVTLKRKLSFSGNSYIADKSVEGKPSMRMNQSMQQRLVTNLLLDTQDMKRQLSMQMSTVERLNVELRNKDAKIEQLQTLRKEMSKICEETNTTLKRQVHGLKHKLGYIEINANIKGTKLASCEKEQESRKMDNDELTRKVVKSQFEIRKTNIEKSCLQNKTLLAEKELSKCKDQCSKLTMAQATTDSYVRSLDKSLKTAEEKNHNLMLQKKNLQDTLTQRKTLIDAHMSRAKVNEKFISRLAVDLQNTTGALQQVLKERSDLNKETNELRAKIIEIMEHKKKVEETAAKKEKIIADLMTQIAKFETDLELNKNSLRGCQRKVSLSEAQTIQYLTEIQLLRKELALKDQEDRTAYFNFQICLEVINNMEIVNTRQQNLIENKNRQIEVKSAKIEFLIEKFKSSSIELESYMLWSEDLKRDFKREYMLAQKYEKERNIFAARVVQAITKEKLMDMKIDEALMVISTGKRAYEERIKDIFVLKREIRNMRRQIKIIKSKYEQFDSIKSECVSLEKKFRLEKLKRIDAENDKLTRFHENRVLQAVFPSKYDLMQKNQTLVKCVIRKSEVIAAKEVEIIQFIKNIMKMKVLLAAAKIDPKQKIEITETKTDNAKKERQIKSLTAELNCVRFELANKTMQIGGFCKQKRDHFELTDETPNKQEANSNKRKRNSISNKPSKVRPCPRSALPPIPPSPRRTVAPRKGGGYSVTTPLKCVETPRPTPKQENVKESLYVQSWKAYGGNNNNNKKECADDASEPYTPKHSLPGSYQIVNENYKPSCKKTQDDSSRNVLKDQTYVSNGHVLTNVNSMNRYSVNRGGQLSNNRCNINHKRSSPKYNKRCVSLSSGERMCRSKVKVVSTGLATSCKTSISNIGVEKSTKSHNRTPGGSRVVTNNAVVFKTTSPVAVHTNLNTNRTTKRESKLFSEQGEMLPVDIDSNYDDTPVNNMIMDGKRKQFIDRAIGEKFLRHDINKSTKIITNEFECSDIENKDEMRNFTKGDSIFQLASSNAQINSEITLKDALSTEEIEDSYLRDVVSDNNDTDFSETEYDDIRNLGTGDDF